MSRNTGKTISEAEFRRLWADLSITVAQIGERLGISQQGVTHRARTRGLPERPKRGAKPACDPERLRRLYDAGLSMPAIAEILRCDRKTVHNYTVRLGLERRRPGWRPKVTTADVLRLAMAASAREEQEALRLAEMVDGKRTGGDGRRKAA